MLRDQCQPILSTSRNPAAFRARGFVLGGFNRQAEMPGDGRQIICHHIPPAVLPIDGKSHAQGMSVNSIVRWRRRTCKFAEMLRYLVQRNAAVFHGETPGSRFKSRKPALDRIGGPAVASYTPECRGFQAHGRYEERRPARAGVFVR